MVECIAHLTSECRSHRALEARQECALLRVRPTRKFGRPFSSLPALCRSSLHPNIAKNMIGNAPELRLLATRLQRRPPQLSAGSNLHSKALAR